MSFLAPWALALAALAAVPLLLHLFRRDTRRRMAFPAIRYLRSAQDRSARALKLRDRLLLLVRMALVVSIAAAAAVPLLGRGQATDHSPSDLVLIVDNSASMNRTVADTTLLDRQRARALELLDAAVAGDRFWILPSVGPPVAIGGDSRSAAAGLGSIPPTDAAADLAVSVVEALRLLPSDPLRPREILVMSDFQASSVGQVGSPLPEDIRLLLSWSDANADNLAIVDVEAVAPLAGGDGSVRVHVADPGSPGGTDALEVRLAVGDEIVSIGRTAADGSAILRLPDPGEGEHPVSVEIEPSGLRSDDRSAFVLRTTSAPLVRHSGPPDSYVSRALAAMEAGGLVRRAAAGDSVRAWWSEGEPPLSATAGTSMAWVLSPPADDARLARFNAGLERIGIPWQADVAASRGSTGPASGAGIPGLENVELRARHLLRRTGASTDSVLVRTGDGLPWIVAGRVEESDYVLIASPLVPEHTGLPIEAAMVPFVETVLFRWARLGGSLPAPTPAGTPELLPAGVDSVRLPSGEGFRVDGGSPYVPLRAGIHTAYFRAGGNLALAAIMPRRESDLTPSTHEAAGRALGSESAVVAVSEREWTAAMYGQRRGRSAVPVLLGLCVLLAVAEGFLATPGRGSRAAGDRRAREPV